MTFLLSFGIRAEAFPGLQLDIIGGTYDPVTQTIVASGPTFQLVAVFTPRNNASASELEAMLNDTYYISAAVTPPVGPAGATLGSFSFNGANYDVTDDLTYGTPPIEVFSDAVDDPGDLPSHGIFPTYFAEFSFQFTTSQRTLRYDTAENTSGLTPTSSTDLRQIAYYQTFNISTALLDPGTQIHFDLYNSYVRNCAFNGGCALDEDVAWFAPFSHDAESAPVPEPQTLMVMSTGLLLAGRLLARRRRVR